MFELDAETARWLIGSAGRAAVADAAARLDAGADGLSTLDALRRATPEPLRTSAALDAAMARRRARSHWQAADELLFTREALEQASDPNVSRWRAGRYGERSRSVLDLCAGAGGDTLAIAALGHAVTAVDLDEGRLILLEHNAEVLGLRVSTQVGDALLASSEPGQWVHVDPGRRSNGRRIRALRDHLPPVPKLVSRHGDAEALGIVLSPAVDLHDPDLPDGELEFVQLGGALVEAVSWLGAARSEDGVASASLLPASGSGSDVTHHLARTGPPTELAVGQVGDYLVEVAPAAIRARLHGQLGEQIDAYRVAKTRALLTAGRRPQPSPWYRVRVVEAVLPLRAKEVTRWLRSAGSQPVEIVLHGIEGDPESWWRRFGRPERGPRGRRINLIRTDTSAIAVVTVDEPTHAGESSGPA